jgi:hypothetical protein
MGIKNPLPIQTLVISPLRNRPRLLRSGQTRFSTPTPSRRKQRSPPAPLKRHPERSLSQSHRERRSRTDPEALNHPIPFRAFQPAVAVVPTNPGAPLMQSHRMSDPSRKARSALLTQPKPRLPTHHPVISTEATDTVCCEVEKPASPPQPHPAASSPLYPPTESSS